MPVSCNVERGRQLGRSSGERRSTQSKQELRGALCTRFAVNVQELRRRSGPAVGRDSGRADEGLVNVMIDGWG